MSLKQAAQHLAAQGRGPDRTLVHMSPREVAGLQAIARAHGGSLTINPETGLAEAGFLDRLMPTLIGAGLAAATGGTSLALTPAMIGAGVGGLTALQTGNLGKGLMAGLGAYGGAGLYGGAEAAGLFGGEQAASTQVPTAGGLAGPVPGVENARDELLLRNTGYDNARDQLLARTVPPEQIATQTAMTNPVTPTPTPMPDMDVVKYGGASMASMADMSRPPIPGIEKYDGPLSKYYMSKDYKAYDPQPPNPYYEPQRYTYGMADGGPVEAMSNAAAVGMNTGYPQADITGHSYSTPWQTPVSQNVVQGTADTGVDRMTGEMNFASGGNVQLQGRVTLDGAGGAGGQSSFGGQDANGFRPMGAVGQQPQGDMPPARLQMLGARMLGNQNGGFSPQGMTQSQLQGLMGGQAQPQTYEQYLAGRNPMQQDVQLTREQFENRGAGATNPVSAFAQGGMPHASAGASLGGYSDGGRMLKGPGDGMSDSIPAQIGAKQPARLADGEFVVPADVVSHLGNGSSDAGAKQLYKMMDRIRAARTGKKRQAPQVNPKRAMPA